jgi:hypothetical protein
VKILPLDEELNTGLENSVRQRKSSTVGWSGSKSASIKHRGDHRGNTIPPSLKPNIFSDFTSIFLVFAFNGE